jgi:hypothetical protein
VKKEQSILTDSIEERKNSNQERKKSKKIELKFYTNATLKSGVLGCSLGVKIKKNGEKNETYSNRHGKLSWYKYGRVRGHIRRDKI